MTVNKYESIREKLKTGDLVLYSYKTFIGKVWQKLTRSKWTHVGLVLRTADTNQIHVWHARLKKHSKTIKRKTSIIT